MNPTREEALFALALSKPAAKRATWLDTECEGDTALRQRLEDLLAAHDQTGNLVVTQAEAARPTIKLDLTKDRRSGGPDAGPLQAAGARR